MVAEAASGKSKHQELQAQARAAAKARRAAELKEKHSKGHKDTKLPASPSDTTAATPEAQATTPVATDAGDPPVRVLNEDSDNPTVKA